MARNKKERAEHAFNEHMFDCFPFNRLAALQHVTVRLQWHNEHSYPLFLQLGPMLSLLLHREKENSKCCVMDHSPPPPPSTEGGEYTCKYPWVLLRKGCTAIFWDTVPERRHWSHLSLPRYAISCIWQQKDATAADFLLPLIFWLKQCHSWRMCKTCWFIQVLQSCTAAFYVQYLPATSLKALGLCLSVSWQECIHPDFAVHA